MISLERGRPFEGLTLRQAALVAGILLVVDGLAWVIDSLQPYLYPNANLDFLSVLVFGELIFMLWLLIAGWRIKEPTAQPNA